MFLSCNTVSRPNERVCLDLHSAFNVFGIHQNNRSSIVEKSIVDSKNHSTDATCGRECMHSAVVA